MSFLVTFLPKTGATPPDLVVDDAPAYSQEFADRIARHLHIREYAIALDADSGWITNRRTKASRHFAYGPTDSGSDPSAPAVAATPGVGLSHQVPTTQEQ